MDICLVLVTAAFLGNIFLKENICCWTLVSSWRLGQRSEQPRGPREAQRSGQAGQCDTLADRVLPQASLQEAQEEGNLCDRSKTNYSAWFFHVWIYFSSLSFTELTS